MATLSSKTGLPSFASSASGSGEINVISNPSAANDTTGWTGVTKVTSGSPLSPAVSTAFSIANAAASESSTSGGYFAISSMPIPLRSYKLKVEFWFTTPATDVYRVSVYAGSTRLSLSSDSSSVTTLPANTTAKFSATFDSTTAAAYSLNITRTSGTTGACVITNVIVGPGQGGQGATIGEWQSYTPTISAGFGTVTGTSFRYRRVGSAIDIRGYFAAGTVAGSVGTFTLPSGLTIDTAAVLANRLTTLGTYSRLANATAAITSVDYSGALTYDSTVGSGAVFFTRAGQSYIYQSAAVNTWLGSSEGISVKIDGLPIAEWASGTVNLGAGAQVEYAYNTGTNTGANTSDTTSFGYGPAGTPVLGYNSTTANGTTDFRCRFQSPIQQDDVITIEVNSGQGWFDVQYVMPLLIFNTSYYGIGFGITNSTDVNVSFGNQGARPTSAATYAASGQAWSVFSAYKWRVRKAKASAPVGFGMANANESGLIKPRKGQTNLTVTGTGWTTTRAVGVYYQDQDGNHRFKFNIVGSVTGSVRTSYTATISGVTFKNGYFPAVAGYTDSGITPHQFYANQSASTLGCAHSSGSTSVYAWSGDVELESKPTWA